METAANAGDLETVNLGMAGLETEFRRLREAMRQ